MPYRVVSSSFSSPNSAFHTSLLFTKPNLFGKHGKDTDEDGFHVHIWPNDHIPAHVHVYRAEGLAIIEIASPRVRVAYKREAEGPAAGDRDRERQPGATAEEMEGDSWRLMLLRPMLSSARR
ncbi:hypothetical protein [Longimicrobium sp.]|uniref:hypothetical protein n=1 Tax=Longimicrobium sp. TaxID=2029185 RepID=UPI002CB13E7B|nr:hypothetical protein [Longimicrobium sp.]HSU14798.1 hypothetical protein [Longimicrobium sp.]